MDEILFIVLMLGFVVAPWWVVAIKYPSSKMIWWAVFWSGVALLVFGFEIAGTIAIGHTISQVFGAFGVEHLAWSWVLCGCMVLAILVLCWHLMAGVYKRRKKQ